MMDVQAFYLAPSCSLPLSQLLSPGQIIVGYQQTSFPFLTRKRLRPESVKCPICLDKERNLAFYLISDQDWRATPKRPDKYDCKSCNGKGLHPIPMTEFYELAIPEDGSVTLT